MSKKKVTDETPLETMEEQIEQPVEQVIEPADEPTEQPTEQPVEEEKPLSDEQKAVYDFVQFWNGLKNHNVVTDEEARHIHSLWQKAAKRTDYYVNCGVCTLNHIKYLKKKARFYVYNCSK